MTVKKAHRTRIIRLRTTGGSSRLEWWATLTARVLQDRIEIVTRGEDLEEHASTPRRGEPWQDLARFMTTTMPEGWRVSGITSGPTATGTRGWRAELLIACWMRWDDGEETWPLTYLAGLPEKWLRGLAERHGGILAFLEKVRHCEEDDPLFALSEVMWDCMTPGPQNWLAELVMRHGTQRNASPVDAALEAHAHELERLWAEEAPLREERERLQQQLQATLEAAFRVGWPEGGSHADKRIRWEAFHEFRETVIDHVQAQFLPNPPHREYLFPCTSGGTRPPRAVPGASP